MYSGLTSATCRRRDKQLCPFAPWLSTRVLEHSVSRQHRSHSSLTQRRKEVVFTGSSCAAGAGCTLPLLRLRCARVATPSTGHGVGLASCVGRWCYAAAQACSCAKALCQWPIGKGPFLMAASWQSPEKGWYMHMQGCVGKGVYVCERCTGAAMASRS